MGYHQIQIEAESNLITASNTKYRHFEFVVFPFGITNAQAIFMGMMDKVFTAILDKFVIVYLDDVLIWSKFFEEHLQCKETVLKRLRHEKLYGKLIKWEIAVKNVEDLGHIISSGGISVDQEKVRLIKE